MPRVPTPPVTKPISTGQLAHAVGRSPDTIRRMEQQGIVRAVRDFRGWRWFAPSEVSRLRALLGWKVLEPMSLEPIDDGDGAAAERSPAADPSPVH